MRRPRPFSVRFRPKAELLEARTTPSAGGLVGIGEEFHPVIVAGALNGSPADSPGARVDPNTTFSPFAGVGSVQVNANKGTYIGTGTPLDSTHILTAGHVVDLNNDGKSDSRDHIGTAYFILNFGGNQTHTIAVSAITTHPDFTGFSRPSVNDDLAILTLASPLPAGVPTYSLPTSDLAAGTTVTMVGYGRSGDGVNGYTTNASWTIKRTGENNADAFYGQDDAGRPAANEVFRFDFDGPTGTGSFGGPTLGNNRETQIGGGDSGGPSFVVSGSTYTIVGVNTFTQGTNAPKFGSLGGSINVYPYLGWINTVLSQQPSAPASGPGGGSGGGNGGSAALELVAAAATWYFGVSADVPVATTDEVPVVARAEPVVAVVAPPRSEKKDPDSGAGVVEVAATDDAWCIPLNPELDGEVALR